MDVESILQKVNLPYCNTSIVLYFTIKCKKCYPTILRTYVDLTLSLIRLLQLPIQVPYRILLAVKIIQFRSLASFTSRSVYPTL